MTPAPAAAASAAPTPAASAAPTLMAHAVAEQVAVSLRQAAKSGDDHIQIQLQPAELGAIAVKLNVNHDGRVTMVVSADRSDTLNMLQQDSATLTQALRDAGLQADSSSLSFNLRGFQMNQQASQGGSSWRDTASTSDSDDLGAVATVASTLRRHSGALDIHV
jgi:flagellar hook-length control protein FliK